MNVSSIHSFRAHPSALYEIRQFIRQFAEQASFPDQSTNDLLVAVSEACANSMLHTNSGEIKVTWTLLDGCVEVKIRDEGVFKKRLRIAEVEGQGAHGIPLMTALVDEFALKEGTDGNPGTLVRLVKCRPD